jgi:hypothetical protein
VQRGQAVLIRAVEGRPDREEVPHSLEMRARKELNRHDGLILYSQLFKKLLTSLSPREIASNKGSVKKSIAIEFILQMRVYLFDPF